MKLVDFGIAKTLDAVERTRPGAIIGKVGYMSPEQCRGEPVDALAAKADDRFQTARAFQAAVEKTLSELGLFASSGGLATLLEELFAEERAFAAVPDRNAGEATQSRMVTLVGEVPHADAASASTASGTGPTQLAPRAPASPAAGHTVTATVRMSPEELAALEDDDTSASGYAGTVQRADLSGLAPSAGAASGHRRRWAAAGAALLALVLLAGALALTAGDTPDPDLVHLAPPTKRTAPAGEGSAGGDAPARSPPERAPSPAPESSNAREQTRGERTTARRTHRRSTTKPPRKGKGTLDVVSLPWAEVFIDGRRRGVTPIKALSVRAGSHELVFVNPEMKLRKTLRVNGSAGGHARVAVKLSN